MKFNRRQVVARLGALAVAPGFAHSAQNDLMIENATIVLGFPPGGTSDLIARRVGAKIGGDYAKSVVVENRTGAAGQLAVTYVKGRPADGTTILSTAFGVLTIYPHTYKKLPYNYLTDLIPVSLGCKLTYGLAVGPAVPYGIRTVPEFLSWAKANPSSASYGSPGTGTTPHFIGALLEKRTGVALAHIPYRGSGPAVLDLVGGSLPSVISPLGEINAQMSTGKLRLLAVASDRRSPFAPNTLTFEEQGVMNMVHNEWLGFLLPVKSAATTVKRLNNSINKALESKEVVDSLAVYAMEVQTTTPAQFSELLRQDYEKWAALVKEIGFTAES